LKEAAGAAAGYGCGIRIFERGASSIERSSARERASTYIQHAEHTPSMTDVTAWEHGSRHSFLDT